MMLGDPRTLGRSVVFVHPPIQHSVDLLRSMYVEVSSTCDYENFIRQPDGARLEKIDGDSGSVSRVSFGRDRITFNEDDPNSSLEWFSRRVEAVLIAAREKFQPLQVLIARVGTQRSTMSLGDGGDSSRWLAEHALQVHDDQLRVFGRPARAIGLRLQLPAQGKQEQHQLRIECYLKDRRQLFIEDIATWGGIVPLANLSPLLEEMREADRFHREDLVEFLRGLDPGN